MRIPLFLRNREIYRRYREILRVLTKNGFGFIVDILSKGGRVPFYLLRGHDAMEIGERIRNTLEELGPTFIKLGQIISTRADLIPHDILIELSKLQDEVAPEDFEAIKRVLEEELGRSVNKVFSYFEETPLASASIGQVYRARTNDGHEVVVKVQRPHVDKKIHADVLILKNIARILNERIVDSPVDFVEIVEELTDSLLNELDYTQEGNNADRFRENFKNEDYIYIPKVYWNYTTKRVLTMEYIDGISVKNKDVLRDMGYDLKKIARMGAWSIFLQVYKFGLFHGDMHPGNILITKEGKISYVDFGIVGYLDKDSRELLIELFKAFAENDTEEVIELLSDVGAIRTDTNLRNLKIDLGKIMNYFFTTPLNKISINDSMKKIMEVVYKYKLMLPPGFTLLLKTMAAVEGVGRDLDPDFSISDVAKDFIKEMYLMKIDVKEIFKENYKDFRKAVIVLKKLPSRVQNIMNKLIKDDIKVRINIDESESLRYDLNMMVNKVIVSIIASALIVGSSLILTYGGGYKVFGYNAIGFFGYVIATMLSLWVFYRIFIVERKKK
ncbi:2-polyprenylphenol 6-hydroxylase [Caldanaerobacter sp.]|uniref:2-polyprenylphenol 6-hydroxylase n=1 Tax=Caldanaerobacter sp. TaxID=2930036 RepID=UPI003C754371